MKRACLLLLVALAWCTSSAADVLIPGTKAVRHELVLRTDEALASVTLVVTPVRGFGGVDVIEPGEPFLFSDKYGTRVYALAAGAAVPDEPEAVRSAAHASGGLPVIQVTAAPLASPLARVQTVLGIVSIEGDEIVLEVLDEHRFDATGREEQPAVLLGLLALVATGGTAALLLLHRRTRGAA